ncbi:MAG TPA: BlaI/MecI/CopY family transcriptional regulator [Thermoanaerobaculia bacterium]|nr:BlaI/MecI/CopY family transcriptional regulator [Thermoanaerobaculia bacterium]
MRRKTDPYSRREREIMSIIYERGAATAAEVIERMASPPSYSAIRAMLRILEQKGHLRHQSEGPRYVYKPTIDREKARRSALDNLLTTFFDGSASSVVSTLLDQHSGSLSEEELENLSELIERARKEGR